MHPNLITLPSHITLPGAVVVPLSCDGTGRWLGFGQISVGGVALRSGRLPLGVDIRTPDGVQISGYQPIACRAIEGGGTALEFACELHPGGAMDWMLHTVRTRVNISDWSRVDELAQDTRLIVELRPVQRHIRDVSMHGFSYRYHFTSNHLRIHRILDRGSWEIGGEISGNTVWSRSAFHPADHTFTSDATARLSSEWYLPGITNPSIFQFLPWQTNGQGFSFTRNDAGCLVTWAHGVTHIRSLFERQRGAQEFMHLHEHCGDLSGDFSTVPMEVLFAPGATQRHSMINLYEGVRDLVWNTLHDEAGIRRERIQSYAVVEEWGLPDFATYRHEAIPTLRALAPKWVMIPNQFQNDMNTWGVSNMCCTVDLKVSDAISAEHLTGFCADIRAWGGQIEMWGNTSFSGLTYHFGIRDHMTHGRQGRIQHLPWAGSVGEIAAKTPQFWLRNQAGHIEADHYNVVFCCANLREPAVTAYWHTAWKDLHEKIGISGIFLDSSFNLSSDKFHWQGEVQGHGGATPDQAHLHGKGRPEREPPGAILTQYHAHLQLVATMQGYGYRYSGEDIGLFGVNRAGASCISRIGNFHLWSESVCAFDAHAIRAVEHDPATVFFTALAYRQIWTIYWNFLAKKLAWTLDKPRDADDLPSTEQIALIQAFDRVESAMIERTVMPDGNVLYQHGQQHVLWAITATKIPLPSTLSVMDVLARTTSEKNSLEAQARHIYVWTEHAAVQQAH